jgi:hypothetical protein
MVKKEELIFQIDSDAVKEAFKSNNYFIEYEGSDEMMVNDLCVLYFSSNDIYYPNTQDSFTHSIMKKDKYEWKRNKIKSAKKHIFLRDIRKQWYLGGVNEYLDTPSKLLEFLKSETSGYRVITVGSSAGGYAALLFGSLLKCESVYAFNAQLNLKVIMKNSNPFVDPILFDRVNDISWVNYFDLSNFISSCTNNYYFQSCRSRIDFEQYEAISLEAQKNIKVFRFWTSNHGFPFLRINLPQVLAFRPEELNQLKDKIWHPIFFSVRLIGLIPTISFVFTAFINRFKKKRLEVRFKN